MIMSSMCVSSDIIKEIHEKIGNNKCKRLKVNITRTDVNRTGVEYKCSGYGTGYGKVVCKDDCILRVEDESRLLTVSGTWSDYKVDSKFMCKDSIRSITGSYVVPTNDYTKTEETNSIEILKKYSKDVSLYIHEIENFTDLSIDKFITKYREQNNINKNFKHDNYLEIIERMVCFLRDNIGGIE